MKKNVSLLTTTEVHNCLKEWLREDPDVDQREYVGIAFMTVKKKIFEDGAMSNTRVIIYDEEYLPVATIETRDFSGIFKKIYNIRHDQICRIDSASKVWETIKYKLNSLWDMLNEALGKIVESGARGLTEQKRSAIEWK